MESIDRGPRRAALWIAAGLSGLALVLALGACAKKVTSVDSSFVTPEGVAGEARAQMVVWYGGATQVRIYADNPPTGPFVDEFCGLLLPGDTDALTQIETYSSSPPTKVLGMIIDRTPASAYQIMRRESGGGYHAFRDFTTPPHRRWPPTQSEVYRFEDPTPGGFDPPTYLGRGLVSGRITPTSPLTNPAVPHQGQVDSIGYLSPCGPTDTLFTLRWTDVPNAARYWIHVYRFSHPPGPQDFLESSLPSPFNNVLPNDIFIAAVDPTTAGAAPSSTYRIGDAARTDVTVLLNRVINFGSVYFVRISAVDSLGQLIAMTPGDFGRISGDGTYALFRVGAAIVSPRRPRAAAEPTGWLAVEREYGRPYLSNLRGSLLR